MQSVCIMSNAELIVCWQTCAKYCYPVACIPSPFGSVWKRDSCKLPESVIVPSWKQHQQLYRSAAVNHDFQGCGVSRHTHRTRIANRLIISGARSILFSFPETVLKYHIRHHLISEENSLKSIWFVIGLAVWLDPGKSQARHAMSHTPAQS